MEIIYLIIGSAIGFVVAFLFFKNKKTVPLEEANKLSEQFNSLKVDAGKLAERIKLFEEDKTNLQFDLKNEREKSEKLTSENSSLKSDYANLQEKLSEQKSEIEKLQEKFTKEFENLANKIFEDKSVKFTEQNKTNLDQILKPLSEKIKDFEKKVDDVYVTDSKERAGLVQQIKSLHELNQQMSKDANNLTSALKGQTKTQGNWGEFILESILEKSGLVKGREYVVQESIAAESGRRFQPDVIINLPENKSIVIDSKVSLVAYERFFSAAEDEERKKALQDHTMSIRAHVKNLSSKKYQDLDQLHSLDFVIMFVPIESALVLALQHDDNLFTDAFEQRILILSPSILLASLKIFSSIWQQEKQNQNAIEIAKQSGALYDKFVGFIQDLKLVGDRIDQAKGSYNDAWNKLKDGSGNLIGRVEKIKKLGAKASKSLPPNVLNRADIDDETNLLDNE